VNAVEVEEVEGWEVGGEDIFVDVVLLLETLWGARDPCPMTHFGL
jgi:hypothetical protein